MKKSVVILILIIYIASIALVSFFGLDFKVFEEVIPVERVEILNPGLKYNERWGNYIVIRPDADGAMRYQIDYRVYPDEATEQSVSFAYDKQTQCATVSELGLVEFSKPGNIKVQVIAMDGSGASASITIIATDK